MEKIRNILISSSVLALILVWGVGSHAAIVDLNKKPGKVTFKAIGKPSFLKINGKKGKAKGKLKINGKSVTGTLSVNLDEMTTGMSLRDRHMKEDYLETKKYPKALLKITKMTLPHSIVGKSGTFKDVPFKALVKIRGVTKKTTGRADVSSDGRKVTAKATFSINIPDHKIDVPSYRGITVAKKVDIQVEMSNQIQ